VVSKVNSHELVEVFVGGLVLDPNTKAPVVILKNESGDVNLPIWIGIPEATGIASAIKQVQLTRPLTHDLLYQIIDVVGVKLQHITITDLRDATYFAEIVMLLGEQSIKLDCRPSDAINLALRANAPIYVARFVFDKAQVGNDSLVAPEAVHSAFEDELPEVLDSEEVETVIPSEVDMQSDFDFNQIDKDKWIEILKNLDPEDFKYRA
jgi:uncharacterized protein